MHSIMILADPLTAAVFMLTDFEVRAVPEPDAAWEALREALSEEYEIVFITEGLAAPLREQIRQVQEETETILTVIPGVGRSQRLGKEMLGALRAAVIGM